MKKRILSMLLVIVMIVGMFPVLPAGAAASSGATGDCTWTFDSATGTLTVSGTGNMADYTSGSQPWYATKTVSPLLSLKKALLLFPNTLFLNFLH